jgi:eukaryotic-like serine/threonine-protein kinase
MPESLGHYKILDRIGASGIGEVYRARDTRLGRTVAIIEVAAAITDDPERRATFSEQARASLVLSHPNIAALYELDDDRGQLYLVREFVAGQTLTSEMGGRPMNPRRALELVIQIADALAAAHAAGIVHRGLTPDHVIVTPKGNAKVLDFGLATWSGAGTEYMPPEQTRAGPVDHRADIFSLGMVLFEMLTGKLPSRGTGSADLASSRHRSLPPELDPILARALAARPDDRYDSAAVLAADLRTIGPLLDARSAAAEPAAAVPFTAARGRRRVATASWFAGAAAVVAALAFASSPARSFIAHAWRGAFGRTPAAVIAVVPFECDPSQIYFADGVSEDLVARLGQTPGLRVIGRSGTRENRGRSPRDVGRELHASVVLTGTISRSGRVATASVQLIDPADGTAFWNHQYTRDVKAIFGLQAQIAEDVGQALDVKLEPTASSARAASRIVDEGAYEAYLKGQQAAAERRLAEARTLYEQAIKLDEGLAEAYAELGEILYREPSSVSPDRRSPRRAALKLAADRGYELAPDSPQVNLAMALASERISERIPYLKKSIAIDPSFSQGYRQIGDEIVDVDPDRAVAFYRRALTLDPPLTAEVVERLIAAGLLDDAGRALDAAAPENRAALAARLQAARAVDERRYADAAAIFAKKDLYRQSPWLPIEYAAALQQVGRSKDAYEVTNELVRRDPDDCDAAAMVAALAMDRKQAAAARQFAAGGLAWASDAEPDGPALHCAADSAAAIGSPAAAVALLRRIATDERLLTEWSRGDLGTTGRHFLRMPRYPWTRVASLPSVIDAIRALDRVYAAARQQSAALLADVTPTQ